ncbi:hypothetical protein BC828DRAFT_184694 [Blastocladiella britannica]|nr:hypothetical protein BC828DRAFT_184694 [Blastocladiella britannica]
MSLSVRPFISSSTKKEEAASLKTTKKKIWFTGPVTSTSPSTADRPSTTFHRYETKNNVYSNANWTARTPEATLPTMSGVDSGIKYYASLVTMERDSWANMAVGLHFEVSAGGSRTGKSPGAFIARMVITHGEIRTPLALFVPASATDPSADPAGPATPLASDCQGGFIGKMVTIASNPEATHASVKISVEFVPVATGAPAVPVYMPASRGMLEFLDAEGGVCDTELRAGDIGNAPIGVSRVVLAASSAFFRKLFNDVPVVSSTAVVVADKPKPEATDATDSAAATPAPPTPELAATEAPSAPASSAAHWSEARAVAAHRPIALPNWSVAALVLSLIHMYSGWVPGRTLPADAVRVLRKHKVAIDAMDADEWREVYKLARMLELRGFAAAVNRQMARVLDLEHRRLMEQEALESGGVLAAESDVDDEI